MSGDPSSPASGDAVERTGRLMGRARDVLAYSHLDSILQRPLYHAEDAVFPQFVARAEGCELVDTTGQRFVDWVGGGGPVLLGYGHPAVDAALHEVLARGSSLTLMDPLEVEVATTITELVPCAERVAFGKNGSDALTAAVRAARALTGRDLILQYGMHGFHDWYVCHNPDVRGASESLKPLICSFPYNDLPALEALFDQHEQRVAAVVMEPVREVLPEPGYVERVRELTHRHGALLVFDEVVTAFRLGNGGGQAFVGVEPDFACLGKAMGNGLPLAALTGPRRTMDVVPAVAFGMTFRGEALALAAARAVLGVLRAEPVAEHLAAVGEAVRAGFHASCTRHGVRSRLSGPPARMTFVFEDQRGRGWESLQALFVQECLKRGVFTNGNVLPSYAHDEAAVERTLRGFDGALAVVARALDEPAAAATHAMIATGYIERVSRIDGALHLSGWMLLADGAPDAIEVRLPGGDRVAARAIERPDVAASRPEAASALRAGFAVILPEAELRVGARLELMLLALRAGRTAFLCRVVLEGDALPDMLWLGDGVVFAGVGGSA